MAASEIKNGWSVKVIDLLPDRIIYAVRSSQLTENTEFDAYIDDQFIGVAQISVRSQDAPENGYMFESLLPEPANDLPLQGNLNIRLSGHSDWLASCPLAQDDMLSRAVPTLENQSDHVEVWQGSIDSIDRDKVRGWVKLSDSDLSETIDVYIGDSLLSSGHVCDKPRSDLLTAGYSSIFHGFEVSILPIYPFEEPYCKVVIKSCKTQMPIFSKDFPNPGLKAKYVGVIDRVADVVSGWFVDENSKGRTFLAELLIDGVLYKTINNNGARPDLANKGISYGQGGFHLPFASHLLEPGSHIISIKFPNGTTISSKPIMVDVREPATAFNSSSYVGHSVSIIIPIFNAYEDLVECLNCLLRNTPDFARIILIDDASTDQRVSKFLDQYDESERIVVFRNEINRGFTRTVNRGLEVTGQDDVVILNSDARVTNKWLQGLLIAAKSAPRIATVTPLSDNAGAFSAPRVDAPNLLPSNLSEEVFATAFRRRSSCSYPRVPTGNGFCMFISRNCIDAIGCLDADAFPRGYGEENDFCMRALRAGWYNIIDDRTYVFHARSRSFGEAKHELMASGREVLDKRYPEYVYAIQVFGKSAELNMARYNARLAMEDCESGSAQLPRVLFVISTTTGGTPQTNMDLMAALCDAIEPWLLRCDSLELELSVFRRGEQTVVRRHKLGEPVNPITHLSAEYDRIVGGWLFRYDIELLHIRHIAWHSLSIIEIAKLLGIPTIVSFHDYYTISPTVKLVDDEGEFLGTSFRQEGSQFRESLWPLDSMPAPTGEWLKHWRNKFAAALEQADAYITTSFSARDYLTNAIPALSSKFHVIPHGRDFEKFCSLRQSVSYDEPIKILVPGNINSAKGLNLILELAKIDRAKCLEFHIIGKVGADVSNFGKSIVLHGAYKREEFAKKVAAIRPHFGAVFSIWDETYCHTLTELWSVGLPVFVLDYPTVASRVSQSGGGWVLKQGPSSELYNSIIKIAFSAIEESQASYSLLNWQRGDGLVNSTRLMAVQYLDIYREAIINEAFDPNKRFSIKTQVRPRIAVVCPADGSLKSAPGSTHIRVWERTRNAVDRPLTFVRAKSETLLASIEAGVIQGAVIQRNAVPNTIVEKVVDRLSAKKIPFLYDIDDDLLNVPKSHDSDEFYSSYSASMLTLLGAASIVSVSTEQLLRRISIFTPRGVVIPNALSDRLWRPSVSSREPDAFISAVYMGTVSHTADFNFVLPALEEVAKMFPRFRLYLIGILSDGEAIRGREDWLEVVKPPAGCTDYCKFVPWLKEQARRFDFGIAPLMRTEFNDAKSDLKLLEYSGLGLPSVCSDVPAYNQSDTPATLVANSMEDWVQALSVRVSAGGDNRLLGKTCRGHVLDNRTLGLTLRSYDDLLMEMV